jgi:hypothetical protein
MVADVGNYDADNTLVRSNRSQLILLSAWLRDPLSISMVVNLRVWRARESGIQNWEAGR